LALAHRTRRPGTVKRITHRGSFPLPADRHSRHRVNVLAASVGRPSLDDVFLRETGRSLRDAGPAGSRSAADAAGQEVAA
jgi:hypothetical protein